MLEWDKFLNVEQNVGDYIGFKTFFRPMGLLDMVLPLIPFFFLVYVGNCVGVYFLEFNWHHVIGNNNTKKDPCTSYDNVMVKLVHVTMNIKLEA